MVIVDTNVLIYSVHVSSPHHDAAHRWLTQAVAGSEVLGLPWQSLLGFVRITTNPRIFSQPLSVAQAMGAAEAWLAHPRVTTPEPTPQHLPILHGLLLRSGTAGNLTADAHLAALCVEYAARVASFDRDLGRFGVEVLVPAP